MLCSSVASTPIAGAPQPERLRRALAPVLPVWSVGAPDHAERGEAERLLGRFGEVVFAPFDNGPPVADRHAQGPRAVAEGDDRPAGKRPVGHAQRGGGEVDPAGGGAAA